MLIGFDLGRLLSQKVALFVGHLADLSLRDRHDLPRRVIDYPVDDVIFGIRVAHFLRQRLVVFPWSGPKRLPRSAIVHTNGSSPLLASCEPPLSRLTALLGTRVVAQIGVRGVGVRFILKIGHTQLE